MTRNKNIMVRVTKEEKEAIDSYAKLKHTPTAALIRQIILQLATKEIKI